MATQSRKSVKYDEVHMGDFETTVFDGQTSTEVWAAACVQLYTEDVKIYGCIEDLYSYLVSRNCNLICYFHNLKFDGAFWIDFLMKKSGLKQALMEDQVNGVKVYKWIEDNEMQDGTYKYTISDKGMWYTILIKANGKYIEIRDSLKLLPFSVERIGKAFKTKHQKLSMEYKGQR